jgi:hypothetical protein
LLCSGCWCLWGICGKGYTTDTVCDLLCRCIRCTSRADTQGRSIRA